jgi:hypothetical protein
LELLLVSLAGWGQLGMLGRGAGGSEEVLPAAWGQHQDIAGLDPDQAAASICWTAETIFLGALHTDAPPPP